MAGHSKWNNKKEKDGPEPKQNLNKIGRELAVAVKKRRQGTLTQLKIKRLLSL